MPKRTLIVPLILLLVGAGCSSSPVEPIDDEPELDAYQVQVLLWRIEVEGDCDANVALVPNQGEFHYRVDVAYTDLDGEDVTDDYVVANTPLYGNPREGDMIKRNAGENIEFSEEHGNDTESIFTTHEGQSYTIQFWMSEFDGNTADDRLEPPKELTVTVEDETGYELDMQLGSDEACRVKLKGIVRHELR